jgi:pyrroloquinoline quinone (PQQ) biosynthesis protein C
MSFYEHLTAATAADRAQLFAAPVVADCLQGRVTLASYLAFLGQAYHHVRHTTPLLMTLGGRLPERLSWLRRAVAEYIDEEIGHEEWILNDIAAAGGDADAVRAVSPDLPAEVMVAYAYDLLNRGNPAAFFGMVFVLEGTSVALALQAADRIQQALALPNKAFSYLRSHGTLDQEHTRHLADLLERMTPADQADVLRSARVFYQLYGDVFRALPSAEEQPCKLKNARILLTGASGGLGQELACQLTDGRRRAAARRARQRAPECPGDLAGAGRCQYLRRSRARVRSRRPGRRRARVRGQRADQQCRRRRFRPARESGLGRDRARPGDQPGSANPPDACPAAVAQGAAAGGDRQHRFDLRQLAISRLRRLLGGQGRTARLFPGLAPRTGRFAGRRDSHRAARDRYAAQHRRGQGPEPCPEKPQRQSEDVARQVVAALRRGDGEHHFGFPERLFAWLNGFAPSLIDRGLAGKLAIIKQHSPSSS